MVQIPCPVGSTLDAPLDREAAALFHITRAWAPGGGRGGDERPSIDQEADRLARDDAGTLTNIAILLERLGREAASRETVFRALQADSAFPEAWNLLGALDLSRGRWDQALEAFGRCLETRRWDPIALDGRALALEGSGRMEEALRVWRELIAAQSSYAPAYRNLGLALARGDREESARLLSEYLRRSPSAPDRKAIERTLRGKVGPSSPFKGSER
jgi:tetratricopeptide (TPR) repeat protein